MSLALGVAALGTLGALCRYLADLGISAVLGRRLPWGTMTVNIVGSGLAGIVLGATTYQTLSPTLATLLLVGFLGGFTTASTIAYEAARLITAGRQVAALGIIAGTMLMATFAGVLGLAVGGGA